MAIAANSHGDPASSPADRPASSAVAALVSQVAPLLLFGVRLWAAVCLALYVAFALELSDPSWAATTAALVCQPSLGASLRKGWFRMIGTFIGASASVALSAAFPQDRAGFLIGLSLWGGLCAMTTTLLRNFAAYAAALAGYTAVIVAADELGTVGGTNGQAFTIAIARVSEISLGIVCAGVVLASTDFGGARQRLAKLMAGLIGDISAQFALSLRRERPEAFTQPERREFIRRVIALDPVIDEAKGESSTLRYHSPVLQRALQAMFVVLAAWRTIDARLSREPDSAGPQQTQDILNRIPAELRETLETQNSSAWLDDPAQKARTSRAASRTLAALPVRSVSLRMVADQAAAALSGFAQVLDGLALLAGDTSQEPVTGHGASLHVADWLPPLVNAVRAFAAIIAVQLFWIWTAWPNGPFAMIFTAVTVILLSPRSEEAYGAAVQFMAGTSIAAVAAAVILFAALPNVESFAGLGAVLGLYLIPAGALLAYKRTSTFVLPIATNFIPLLGPTNQMQYNTVQFYNSAVAIMLGCAAGALSFRLIPPLTPEFRIRRLLMLSLRDLRRLALDPARRESGWTGRLISRITALPANAAPLHRARLVTALAMGRTMVLLQHNAAQLGLSRAFEAAMASFSAGDCAETTTRLMSMDLAAMDQDSVPVMRTRAQRLAICDGLADHRAYFESGAGH